MVDGGPNRLPKREAPNERERPSPLTLPPASAVAPQAVVDADTPAVTANEPAWQGDSFSIADSGGNAALASLESGEKQPNAGLSDSAVPLPNPTASSGQSLRRYRYPEPKAKSHTPPVSVASAVVSMASAASDPFTAHFRFQRSRHAMINALHESLGPEVLSRLPDGSIHLYGDVLDGLGDFVHLLRAAQTLKPTFASKMRVFAYDTRPQARRREQLQAVARDYGVDVQIIDDDSARSFRQVPAPLVKFGVSCVKKSHHIFQCLRCDLGEMSTLPDAEKSMALNNPDFGPHTMGPMPFNTGLWLDPLVEDPASRLRDASPQLLKTLGLAADEGEGELAKRNWLKKTSVNSIFTYDQARDVFGIHCILEMLRRDPTLAGRYDDAGPTRVVIKLNRTDNDGRDKWKDAQHLADCCFFGEENRDNASSSHHRLTSPSVTPGRTRLVFIGAQGEETTAFIGGAGEEGCAGEAAGAAGAEIRILGCRLGGKDWEDYKGLCTGLKAAQGDNGVSDCWSQPTSLPPVMFHTDTFGAMKACYHRNACALVSLLPNETPGKQELSKYFRFISTTASNRPGSFPEAQARAAALAAIWRENPDGIQIAWKDLAARVRAESCLNDVLNQMVTECCVEALFPGSTLCKYQLLQESELTDDGRARLYVQGIRASQAFRAASAGTS